MTKNFTPPIVHKPMIEIQARAWSRFDPAASPQEFGRFYENSELLRRDSTKGRDRRTSTEELGRRIASKFGLERRFLLKAPWEPISAALPSTEDLVEATLRGIAGPDPSALILGSTTSARWTGSHAAAVAGRLGWRIPAYDLRAGCATSLVSLDLAATLLASRHDDLILACGETLSKTIDSQNSETWFGLADGAAAVSLSRADMRFNESGHDRGARFVLEKSVYYTDGRFADLYTVPGRLPPAPQTDADLDFVMRGDGRSLMEQALRNYGLLIDAILPDADSKSRISWILPHQVNRELVVRVCREANLGATILWDADVHGCIGGATILHSLVLHLERGTFASDDRILLMAVGGGLSCAAQVWRWI